MIWHILALIGIIAIVGLTIWLLVRQGQSVCETKGKLNSPCTENLDCNSGLTCESSSKICKVATDGVCETSSDCLSTHRCLNGVCTILLGTLNQPCPCASGFSCVNNVCKAITGQACTNSSDCVSGICEENICKADSSLTSLMPANGGNMTDCYTDYYSDSSKSKSSYGTSSSSRKTYSDTSVYSCSDPDCSLSKVETEEYSDEYNSKEYSYF